MNLQKTIQIIKKNKRFLITTHVNPDPDALCSELALALFLRFLGKEVVIVNEGDVPERYLFLPKAKTIKTFYSGLRSQFDAVIILDCGDLDRIGDVKRLIKNNHIIINIDHHITNDRFGHFNLIDVKASSTAEILYQFLSAQKFPWTKEAALLIYLGIMTDTGSFRYDNTTPETHRIVSELLKFNLSVSSMYRKLYETIPLSDLKHFSAVINRFETFYSGQVVCLSLTKKDTAKFSEKFDLRDAIFKFLRSINGVEALFIFTEINSQETRLNMRSTGKVDVAKVAHHFEGGGHRRASGCMLDGNLKDARQKALNYIRKFL